MSRRALLLAATALLLGGCATQLKRLGDGAGPPRMTPTSDPTKDPNYHPVTLPMSPPQPVVQTANSLWQPGSRAFFIDQRASHVGDIITIVVDITDTAEFNDNTTATVTGNDNMGITNLFGLENTIKRAFNTTPASVVNTSTNSGNTTLGQIQRNETVTVRLAGMITQVLPNGNFFVVAHQEVRVNSELRELMVTGIVRPQDIAADNTVPHDRMAEARISYGGRGELVDLQAPRYGQQLLDILLPF